MTVYRIAQEKWIYDLSGKGAKLAGGRWNPKGYSVLYCASNSSLAILEKIAQTSLKNWLRDLCIIEILIENSSSVKELNPTELPHNWKMHPSPDILKLLGKDWLKSNQTLILEVPSAVNEIDKNILINPFHPEFQNVKVGKSYPYIVDDRLIT